MGFFRPKVREEQVNRIIAALKAEKEAFRREGELNPGGEIRGEGDRATMLGGDGRSPGQLGLDRATAILQRTIDNASRDEYYEALKRYKPISLPAAIKLPWPEPELPWLRDRGSKPSRTKPTSPSHQADPAPRPTTSISGGSSSMSSIEELRAALMAANGRATEIAAALTQAVTVAEEIRAQIQRITTGSGQAAIQDAPAMYTRVLDQISEARSMVLAASTTVEGYATHL